MSPEVTVVIPTRDRWPLMCRTAVSAALRQQDVELEVVIVDDGSTEPMPARLPGLDDPRLCVIRHETPRGVAQARNTGLHEARGEWIAFLDDDDVWSPHKLRRQLDAAGTVSAGFAYAGAVWVDENLQLVRGHAPPAAETLAQALLRWNVLWGGGSNVLARTQVVRSLGGFDEQLFQLADWDLWIRLALASSGAVIGDVLVGLLVHRRSMLLVDGRDVFSEFAYLSDKHRQASERAGVEFDRARFARWAATGHLRAGRRFVAARTFVRGTVAPGNVLRAGAALLGPSGLVAVRRLRGSTPGAIAEGRAIGRRPEWLDLYR
jgi:glycosyltransferase involved in cell wall biosynthesis